MAERLARDLADRGLVIASGLARGIDSSAHKGALARCGSARLGCWDAGLTWSTRRRIRRFSRKSQRRARSFSEFPMGTFPAPQNFPIRNRIIAGMALGVVVVEGAQYSGSLITARLAMEFGREVYGVPGNATQPSSFGPNQLIKQGAKLVTSWEDVVEELPDAGAGRADAGGTPLPRSAHRWWRRVWRRRAAAVRASERGRGAARGRIGRDFRAQFLRSAGGAI